VFYPHLILLQKFIAGMKTRMVIVFCWAAVLTIN